MPRPRGRPRKYWGPHNWAPVVPAGGPSPWADTEAWLRELLEAGAIAACTGAAGVWEITRPNGLRATVTAEKDAAMREEAAILGAAR